MQIRGFLQTRGFFKNSAASCAAVLLSVASMTSYALPTKFDTPPCNENGACYHAVDKQKNKDKAEQNSPAVETDVPAPLNEFGEVLYPKVDESIAQTGSSTLELEMQAPEAVVGSYNELFNYVDQTSQQGEQIARLELEELQAAKSEEASWATSIPVPEPATVALMGLGVLGLILLSRRGRSKG